MTWNAKAYDSDKTWKDSIRILFPGCASAMQTFANHNSDGGPSGHNYRKEESVEIAPVVEQVLDQCRRGAKVADSKAFERLKAEFSKMAQAPDVIRAKSNNPAFVAEVEPWLIQFESLGKAGLNSMQMLEATEAGNSSAALNYAMEAACLLAEMQRYSKEISKAINKHVTEVTKKNSPWQTAVKPSELVMAPAVRELLDLGSTPVLSRVSGQAVGRVKPYVSTKLKNGIEKMLDDDPESYFYCKEVQKKGDFFGVDLGVPREIRTVSIVMGRNDSDKDAVNKGQLEVSMDGQSWSPLMPETSGVRVEYQGSGKKGRFVRYRATVQGVPGGKSDVWTAIRDFKVNAPAAPSVLTDAPAFKSAVAETGDRDISLKRIMEVHPLSPRKSLGLQIPAGAAVESASINLKTPGYEVGQTVYFHGREGVDGSAAESGRLRRDRRSGERSQAGECRFIPAGGDAGRVQAQSCQQGQEGRQQRRGRRFQPGYVPARGVVPGAGGDSLHFSAGEFGHRPVGRQGSYRSGLRRGWPLGSRGQSGQGEKSDHLEFEVRQEAGQGYRPYGQEGYFREYF